ncbi:MAG: glycosyltransferase [Pseudomonadota bacterium]
MNWTAAVPLMVVTGVILAAPRELFERRWVQVATVFALAMMVLKYLHWRMLETVLPAEGSALQVGFIWAVFIIEALTWFDAAILFAFLLNRTDRSREADAHEARLGRTPRDDLPEVDVFIATYNEPADVLDRTISGAIALDWPGAKLNVWILDDGRREWLEREAALRGVGYITRADNAGAKAGNINHAVLQTKAPFILVLDADFVPQRTLLMRTMGFFEDPRIGIMQVPHCFFNSDPMQSALQMDKVMPDDQRFFFEVIMPGRDGYDCAFCCGSNGIIRRTALEEIGNAMPEGSITEDMLLTLAFKRRGYITRFLNERLAFGLAPEGIGAFFVQRARWARGGIQIMFLKEGPFGGRGLTLAERLFFLPTHWITQSLGQTVAMVTPALFLLTGLMPLANTTPSDILQYQVPAIVATIAAVRFFAPGAYHPLATLALSTLQAFRLLPVVLSTLFKPFGHGFKVTPKGQSGAVDQDGYTVKAALGLAGLTSLGLSINASASLQIVPFSHLIPIVTFWALLNTVVLLLVAKIATSPPARRTEERFRLEEPVGLTTEQWSADAHCVDMSLTGALLEVDGPLGLEAGDWIGVDIADVGLVPSRIVRQVGHNRLGVAFALLSLEKRRDRHASVRSTRDVRRPSSGSAEIRHHGRTLPGRVVNTSPEGACLRLETASPPPPGAWVNTSLADAGPLTASIAFARQRGAGSEIGLDFKIVEGDPRNRLVRKLFTEGRSNKKVTTENGWRIFVAMLGGIFSKDAEEFTSRAPSNVDQSVPDWLSDRALRAMEERSEDTGDRRAA